MKTIQKFTLTHNLTEISEDLSRLQTLVNEAHSIIEKLEATGVVIQVHPEKAASSDPASDPK